MWNSPRRVHGERFTERDLDSFKLWQLLRFAMMIVQSTGICSLGGTLPVHRLIVHSSWITGYPEVTNPYPVCRLSARNLPCRSPNPAPRKRLCPPSCRVII